MNNIQKNLHLIFLALGILFGFLVFAKAAAVDPVAGILAYLLFYLPAFFGGTYLGKERAEDSDMLDGAVDMVDNMFKIELDSMGQSDSPNHILAATITLFYFAFWVILGFALDIPVVGYFIKWILPSFLFGLFTNKDTIESVKPLAQKFKKFLIKLFKASGFANPSNE